MPDERLAELAGLVLALRRLRDEKAEYLKEQNGAITTLAQQIDLLAAEIESGQGRLFAAAA